MRANFVDEEKQRKYVILALMVMFLFLLTSIHKTVVDIGPGITHQNHEDTITTPLAGNCPNCPYPDCGGCDGQPQITLAPTEIVATIPPFQDPATPDIPDATQYPTIFPTFDIDGLLPTAIPTLGLPTVVPTVIAPDFPASPIPVGTVPTGN